MSASQRVVLDTNVLSYLLRQSLMGAHYKRLLTGTIGCVACVTPEELYFGAVSRNWGSQRRKALAALIDNYELLPVSLDIAVISACIRAERSRVGRPIEKADAWIAATALGHGLPLISHDKDFEGIQGLHLITLREMTLEDVCRAGSALEDGSLQAAPWTCASFGSPLLQ